MTLQLHSYVVFVWFDATEAYLYRPKFPRILGLLSPRQDLVDELNGAVSQLLTSTFRRRMTYVSSVLV